MLFVGLRKTPKFPVVPASGGMCHPLLGLMRAFRPGAQFPGLHRGHWPHEVGLSAEAGIFSGH